MRALGSLIFRIVAAYAAIKTARHGLRVGQIILGDSGGLHAPPGPRELVSKEGGTFAYVDEGWIEVGISSERLGAIPTGREPSCCPK